MSTNSARLFTWRQILLYFAAFAGVTILIQRSFRYISENWIAFDCPYYWPVSVLNLRFPSIRDLIVALIVSVGFLVIIRFLEHKHFDPRLVVLSGVLLIAGLTFIHGIDVGFYAPVAGDAQSGVLVPNSLEGQEYYHDALTITGPLDFLDRYNEIQPTLHRHAHTHPPGAVLTLYFLQKVLQNPALIALVMMLAATVLTAYFFRRLLLTAIDNDTANYVTFLILLLPAFQIYYLATIDALIAGLLSGTLYYFCFGTGRRSVAGAVALLSASFFLTFVSLFILPVLAGYELITKRSLKRWIVVVGSTAAVYLLIYLVTGYNAVQSFRTASLFENARGFMLLADPANYFFTRIEDVAEIILFLGPFALVLFFRGLKGFRERPLILLTGLATVTMLAMFVTGAWRTGETARACLYLYPYLLFPVAHYLQDTESSATSRLQLVSLVFVQSIVMQTFGNFHW